jgi:hypothetical protein
MTLADPLVNIGSTAGLYSQVAGVLAGFAFTALLIYLNRPADGALDGVHGSGGTAHRDVTVMLFNTLGALIICAILYGVLAGGSPDAANSFSATFINGPAFGFAILGMFFATALAARPFEHLTSMLTAARITVALIGPSIVMALIGTAALDIQITACIARDPSTAAECPLVESARLVSPFSLGLLLTLLLILAAVTFLVWFRRSVVNTGMTPVVLATLILSSAVVAVVGNVFLSTKPPEYLLPVSVVFAVLFVTFAVLILFSFLTARTCHYETPLENAADGNDTVKQGDPTAAEI